MLRFYQTEWFGIPFASLGEPDPERLADGVFYERFYAAFSQRFQRFEDLPADWLAEKEGDAEALLARMPPGGAKILSVGCGNGYIEHLFATRGREVLALEPSSHATALLRRAGSVPVIHGYFPSALPNPAATFPVVYMGAIDYVMKDDELLALLKDARACCTDRFFLLSVSVDDADTPVRRLKSAVKRVLWAIPPINGRMNRGKQLWGYMRTPAELAALLARAGFVVAANDALRPGVRLLTGTVR